MGIAVGEMTSPGVAPLTAAPWSGPQTGQCPAEEVAAPAPGIAGSVGGAATTAPRASARCDAPTGSAPARTRGGTVHQAGWSGLTQALPAREPCPQRPPATLNAPVGVSAGSGSTKRKDSSSKENLNNKKRAPWLANVQLTIKSSNKRTIHTNKYYLFYFLVLTHPSGQRGSVQLRFGCRGNKIAGGSQNSRGVRRQGQRRNARCSVAPVAIRAEVRCHPLPSVNNKMALLWE